MPATHRPLPRQVRADLFAHLAAMEKAGLPPDKAFGLLRLPGAAATRLESTGKLLARGSDPANAGLRSGLFTDLEARCVRAALQAGSPLRTYQRLAAVHAERVQLASSMKARMIVPIVTLLLALILRPLPALVSGSLTIGGYFIKVLWPPAALAGLASLVKWMPQRSPAAHTADRGSQSGRVLLGIPVIGPMTVRSNVRDFLEHLAILLEAGLPMFEALPIAEATMGNTALRSEFARIRPAMVSGANFADALSALPDVGSAHLVGLVRSGEESGCLPEVLFHHVEAETAALSFMQQQLATWLPRLLYAFIAAWIGYSLLSGGAFMPRAGEAS